MDEKDVEKIAQATARLLVAELAKALGVLAPPPPPAPKAEPKYLGVSAFAARVGRSRTTVQNWIKLGLPTVPGRRGHLVKVGAADEWLKMGALRHARLDS